MKQTLLKFILLIFLFQLPCEIFAQKGSHKMSYSSKRKKSAKKGRRSTGAYSRSSNREYITGPRGGCYYINSSGNKVYVDHSYCK